MKFTRSQILRINASVFRRFEVKYSSWPFATYPLTKGVGEPCAEKTAIAQRLLDTPADELDTYSAGTRRLFPTVEALLSGACRATLCADFASHAYTTDVIEQLHTEITHNITHRAPATAFANISRQSVVKQATVHHVRRGGDHPVVPKALVGAPKIEAVRGPAPLLAAGRQEGVALADCAAAAKNIGSTTSSPGGLTTSSAGGREGRIVASGQGDTARRTSQMITFARPCLGTVVATPIAPSTTEAGRKRKGLSPFMLERNKHMAAARRAKGSSLTEAEVQQEQAAFKAY